MGNKPPWIGLRLNQRIENYVLVLKSKDPQLNRQNLFQKLRQNINKNKVSGMTTSKLRSFNWFISLQALMKWTLLSSPFIIFYLFGTLFHSSLNYNFKALVLGLSVVSINMGSRLCSISSDPSIMENLPVSIYLATKVLFLFIKH